MPLATQPFAVFGSSYSRLDVAADARQQFDCVTAGRQMGLLLSVC